ncbi:hypothetical protein [Nannocystis pusilla]|uniref:hypothetical protein n=1 Tax=Nannocystis pusilla TaxID=889268 RepID=UPI003B822F8D
MVGFAASVVGHEPAQGLVVRMGAQQRNEVVIWSDFKQFHRDWICDLGPFVFD